MRLPAPACLVLHEDETLVGALSAALPGGHPIVRTGSWRELRRLARRAQPGAVVVVDPYLDGADGELALDLRRLVRGIRSILVLAAARFRASQYDDARRLGAWGIAHLVLLGRDDSPEGLRRTVLALRAGYFARLLDRLGAPVERDPTRLLLAEALEAAARGLSADGWAERTGVSRGHLRALCLGAGLPAPGRLLAWMRVILVADLLGSPAHSPASVARACGFASAETLLASVRELTGESVVGLRERGLSWTAARVRSALEEGRGRSAAPRGGSAEG